MSKKKNKEQQNSSLKVPEESNLKTNTYSAYWAAGIACTAFLLYLNTIGHNYALDDWGAITGNPYVLEGIKGIPKLFSTDFWHISNIQLGYYRPLALVTFAIEQQFFHGNPHISHFINVLLFAFSGFILFQLLCKIFKTQHILLPLAVSMLYIAHPIHTEIVANIKGRDELLSYLNIILMLLYTLKYADTKKTLHLLLSLIFCYFSLLSKETGLVGVLLIPIAFYYTNFTIKDCIKKTIPFVIVAALFFIQKRYFLGGLSGIIPDDIVNYPYTNSAVKLPTIFMLFTFCLRLLLFPHPLRYDYSFNQIPAADWQGGAAWLGMLLFFTGIYFTFKQVQKKSIWGFSLSVFYITLLPSLAFTFIRGGIFAERFLFMPSLGFCIALVYALFILSGTSKTLFSNDKWISLNIKFLFPLCLLFLLYSLKTISRNMAWKDNYTLMSTDIKTGANSAQNQRHYGGQLINLANGEQDSSKKMMLANKAIAAFRKAIHIYPKFGEAYSEMGVAYHTIINNSDSAIYYYSKAIEYAPGLANSYLYLGRVYHDNLNKNDAASFYYNEAVRINPELLEAKKAADDLRKATGLDVHINPIAAAADTTSAVKDERYYFKQGNYFASQGDYKKAAENFEKSIALKKDNEDAYLNLANCYGMLQQYDRSLAVANEFLEAHPGNISILENIAVTYNLKGDKVRSAQYLEKAKELKSK